MLNVCPKYRTEALFKYLTVLHLLCTHASNRRIGHYTLMDFSEPLKRRFLEQARVQTWLSWALIVSTTSNVLMFHTLMVWSAEPLYMLSLWRGVTHGWGGCHGKRKTTLSFEIMYKEVPDRHTYIHAHPWWHNARTVFSWPERVLTKYCDTSHTCSDHYNICMLY